MMVSLILINKFEEVNELKVNYKIGDRRQGDVVKIYSNSEKAKTILNWRIKEDINSIVKSSWLWTKNKI
jgi:UDP-glucose 4-epimerase